MPFQWHREAHVRGLRDAEAALARLSDAQVTEAFADFAAMFVSGARRPGGARRGRKGEGPLERADEATLRNRHEALRETSLTPVMNAVTRVMREALGNGSKRRKAARKAAAGEVPAAGQAQAGDSASAASKKKRSRKDKFGDYLRQRIGDPPKGMQYPHAHHILYERGNGPGQQKLVEEGQAILRRAGIDPIYGLENLVWAPMSVKGQHAMPALKEVVDRLREVEADGGGFKQFVVALKHLGEIAAARE